MGKTIVLGDLLKRTSFMFGKTQRQVSKEMKYATSTVNGHFKNYPINADTAVAYADIFNSSELNLVTANKLLKVFGILNGNRFKKDPLSLSVIQKREQRQREKVELDYEIDCILAEHSIDLTEKQIEYVMTHLMESMDEILCEISRACSEAELINLSLMDLITMKEPEWIEKQWITPATQKGE
mgnify:CR=1 FL=1